MVVAASASAHLPPSHHVDAFVDRVERLCPVPAAAQRVVELAAGEQADFREIARALAVDAALAAEIMRIANSVMYGRARTVSDLDQAILTIGLDELREMAAAMALVAAFRSDASLSLDLHMRSLLAGALARGLATQLGYLRPATAFVCGLLSDIGAMACLAIDAEGYGKLWAACQGEPGARARAELKRYGASSNEIGKRLLQRNALPTVVVEAVGAQVDDSPDALGPLPRVCLFARQASWSVVRVVDESDLSSFGEILSALALRYRFDGIEHQALMTLCVEASARCDSELRRLRHSSPRM